MAGSCCWNDTRALNVIQMLRQQLVYQQQHRQDQQAIEQDVAWKGAVEAALLVVHNQVWQMQHTPVFLHTHPQSNRMQAAEAQVCEDEPIAPIRSHSVAANEHMQVNELIAGQRYAIVGHSKPQALQEPGVSTPPARSKPSCTAEQAGADRTSAVLPSISYYQGKRFGQHIPKFDISIDHYARVHEAI